MPVKRKKEKKIRISSPTNDIVKSKSYVLVSAEMMQESS